MRNWKIGTFTAGISLIAIGVVWLGNQVWNIPLDRVIANGWPFLLILLGAEILFHQLYRKDTPVKIDFLSIFLLIFLGFISIGVYSMQASGLFTAVKGIVSTSEYSRDINESYEIEENIEEIYIEIPNADLVLEGEETDELMVSGTLEANAEDRQEAENAFNDAITYTTSGNKAYFKIKQPKKTSFLNLDRFHSDLKVHLPSDLYTSINVTNGEIVAEKLSNGAEIRLVNGKIEVFDVQNGLDASLTNGDILLKNIEGEVKAEGVNGSIEAEQGKVTDDWKVGLTNGDMEFSLARTSNATVKAAAKNGTVEGSADWIRPNRKDSPAYKKEGELILGEGEHRINLSVGNGDVAVDLK
ncbi:DUF4097 family beta strand repeat-containing protein [Bacillus marinisedimentorum]|uniref:DUF4097 family beta strand repeat-containing protein n=1 Tax=Bacillus marinisedimentorum TaxID=1821260 RepID=UPI0007E048C3|nr:DUF4097 family beta strand repeat-containing protein [Bacillus marinisedimentorum]